MAIEKKSSLYRYLRVWYQISRPRFWMYLLGPVLIGFVAALPQYASIQDLLIDQWVPLLICMLFFAFPANFIIYGVNDLADQDTDQFNTKKGTQEHKLKGKDSRHVITGLLGTGSIAVLVSLWLLATNTGSFLVLLLFLFLGIAYSLPPFRFKAIPFADAYSNLLYWLPGLLMYYYITHNIPPITILIAATSWTTAMHVFSAIPDISADSKAGLATTATFLGSKKALLFCAAHWLVFSMISLYYSLFIGLLSMLYVGLALLPLLNTPKLSSDKIYWHFPKINTLFGLILWWYLALNNYL